MSIVQIESLHKRYGDTIAVDDVTLRVDEGEVFGILGPNGAGKTTTVECASGLRRPDRGTVRVAGLDPVADRGRVRQLVGVQLQEARLPDKLRVGEAMELYASFYPHPADTDQLLDQLGLGGRRTTYFEDLSGGQQQRLSVALALVGRPRVAVLDELTTGLDPQARRETWRLVEEIRDAGVTVVLVSHAMEEAERLCDRVAVIDRGRVVALDRPDALIAEVAGESRVRFRPSSPFEHRTLTAMPEVHDLVEDDGTLLVTGHGDLVVAITHALLSQGVTPTDVRTEIPTLDDAYLALTGHHPEPTDDRMQEVRR